MHGIHLPFKPAAGERGTDRICIKLLGARLIGDGAYTGSAQAYLDRRPDSDPRGHGISIRFRFENPKWSAEHSWDAPVGQLMHVGRWGRK
jgi:hypothetical protein